MRTFLWTVAGGAWGFGVSLALQKGWLDSFPDWGISALFIVPVLICIYLAVTHGKVRQLVRGCPVMSFVVFVIMGSGIGALSWYAIYKLPLQHGEAAAKQKHLAFSEMTNPELRQATVRFASRLRKFSSDYRQTADELSIKEWSDFSAMVQKIPEAERKTPERQKENHGNPRSGNRSHKVEVRPVRGFI